MDRLNQSVPRGRPVSTVDAAKANDVLEHFINAGTLKAILGDYRMMCELLHLKPNAFPHFYPKLKANLNSWKAKALWKKFDARAGHKCYAKGKVCPNTRVLIIGAGPCGLRTAIEAQLLGAKVVVIEKRDRMSRNNVLHLWPFVIDDLRALGAKKFFGKFCAGAIDHISIRQLQCILLKVALLLGVEVYTEVSFEKLVEPNSTEKIGWRAEFKPFDHPVSQYEFDVIIGADGKRNTLQGFRRKEFRGKLAIAITANFINKRTEAEARVEEISGVAFIFNQKFFKELNAETGIDLENIVYYKDDTHYFVMTAKKPSLIDKGVIKRDFADTAKLLSPDNVDREALMNYAREAADFSTNYQMPVLEFAVNHYGQPDVAMFDFTSMYAAENASRVIEKQGYKLLMILVGDSLLEPFWPTGSGCARGFLSSLDACWAIKAWGSGQTTPLEVLAERESIYRLLAQTTPENLNKDWKAYTVDPSTRYPNLNKAALLPQQVLSLYDTDDPSGIELTSRTSQVNVEPHRKRRRRDTHLDPNTLICWIKEQIREHKDIAVEDLTASFKDGRILCAILQHYRPDLLDYSAIKTDDVAKNNQLAFDLLEKEIGISPVMTGEEMAKAEVPDYLTMFSYLTQIYDAFRGEIPHIKHPKLDLPDLKEPQPPVTTQARAATDMINKYINARPKRHAESNLFNKPSTAPERKPKKRRSFEKPELSVDRENRLPSQTRAAGADEELAARIKDLEDKWRDPIPIDKKPKDLRRAIGKIETSDWNIKQIEKKIMENKMGKVGNAERERVPKWNREQFLARQTKMEKKHLNRQDSAEAKYKDFDKGIKKLEQRLKEGSARDQGQNKVATITEKLATKVSKPESKPVQKTENKPINLPIQGGSDNCHFCQKRVYLMERLSAEGRFFHRGCFKCQYCHTTLRLGSYLFDKEGQYGHRFYCSQHFGMPGELYPLSVEKKVTKKDAFKSLEKLNITPLVGVEGVDLLDRVQTPERIEFANLSAGHISSDHDESLSQMDEDEWTDRNFGASTAEICSSDEDEDSSSLSGSESDNEDAYEEALEEPPTKEGTMKWMERYKQKYSKQRRDDDSESEDYSSSSDHSSYYENSSGDEEDEPVTEGEEEIRARELRKQEVRVEPPVVQTDTGSETEIVSDESTEDSSSKHNSATEISTDSEFAVDDPTPTREAPVIIFNDFHVTKTRGNVRIPKKVQVKSGVLQSPMNGSARKGIQLEFTPLVPSPVLSKPPLLARNEGYALNRTQSTGGIATKVSLELKKKYLLGDGAVPGGIQKSGSVSTLDSKFKSFHTNISDCQRLLKPAPDISPSMQVFCHKLNEVRSPLLSPVISQASPFAEPEDSVKSSNSVKCELVQNEKGTEESDVPRNVELPKTEGQVAEFQHELEGRPRSPVQEIPIIVPQINWSRASKKKESDISSDSLTSDTESEEDERRPGIQKSPTVKIFTPIPKVEVQDDTGFIINSGDDLPPDSLCPTIETRQTPPNDAPKSITSEKKTLNQPKTLPGFPAQRLHDVNSTPSEQKITLLDEQKTSGHSTPSDHDSYVEHTGALMTETELSDWARDSAVSDDFEEDFHEYKRLNREPTKANMDEFDDLGHVCGKEKQIKDLKNKMSLGENLNNVLSSLEFMDTGEETSSDEKEASLKNNGYVELQNEDDMAEDSLDLNINNHMKLVEAVNFHQPLEQLENLSSHDKNTGYCIIGNEPEDMKGNVNKSSKRVNRVNEDDSLLAVEGGTTTEENTCSDSTFKILNQTITDKEKKDILNAVSLISENKALLDKIHEERRNSVDCKESVKVISKEPPQVTNEVNNKDSKTEKTLNSNHEYEEHCQRLQSKVEFGNVRDSIDIRKSKRKEKSESGPKPDLIQEENLVKSPKLVYTKEEIQKVRDENQRLVQEMVMNKMKAQNKSLERKKRSRNFSPSLSPSRPFDLSKSATTDLSKQYDDSKRISAYSTSSSIYSTPDVLLSTNNKLGPLQRSPTFTGVTETSMPLKVFSKQLSVHSSFQKKLLPDTPLTNPEAFSLPDIQKALNDFKSPKPPPRQKNELQRTTEKLKHEARARARLMSNEDLGLSPEDKLKLLKEKFKRDKENENVDVQDSIESLVLNTERRNSLLYSNDTLKKKRTNSFRRSKSGEETSQLLIATPVRTKSVSEISRSIKLAEVDLNASNKTYQTQCYKSDPNLLIDGTKDEKKSKSKDKERRKSLTKFITDFFGKKKDGKSITGSSPKGFLARISPKSKSKSMINLAGKILEKTAELPRTNSFSENLSHRRHFDNISPPPIPPLPLNYTEPSRCTDESSDGEHDWRRHERSCGDAIDQSGGHESRRNSRTARRLSRQTQLKRHRMAQEIQRKLEETEVKTRELEERGVSVEKALRGESEDVKEESELLKEWFDLMRDLTELRRYEKELMVRAQELELEDRHARLQQELRERLENEEHKTKEDVKVESSIINEMMEIVAKRDSLIALLEQDRIRYTEEDRDFEEQMLAKGLQLIPLQKNLDK